MSRLEIVDEKPRTWKHPSTQRVVGEVVPLLSELQDVLKIGHAEDSIAPGPLEASGAEGSGPVAKSFDGHPSHDMVTRGRFSWCKRCGSYTSGVRVSKMLRADCTKVTPGGKLQPQRVARGLPPDAKSTDWGDPD